MGCLLAPGNSIGSVFWFQSSLYSRARQARSFTFGNTLSTEQGCPYSLKKIPLSGEVELFSFFEGCWHFDWFCLLNFSRNWRARQAHSFIFGITLSTEQGCPSSLEKFPLSGEVELVSFFLKELSFGYWHLDRFSILISRNWRARQARSFTFGFTLITEQGCPSSLEKFPL